MGSPRSWVLGCQSSFLSLSSSPSRPRRQIRRCATAVVHHIEPRRTIGGALHRWVGIAVSAALAMACGACPPVAAGSESLIAQASDVAPGSAVHGSASRSVHGSASRSVHGSASRSVHGPGATPAPSADPEPQPAPSTDPEPQPAPSTDPEPQPEPSVDPEPQPDPSTDPQPDSDPQPDPDQASDDGSAPGDTAAERPSGEHAGGGIRPPAPAAAIAATAGTQASVDGAPPADIATAPNAAVVKAATGPTTRKAARGGSVVARLVCGEAKAIALSPEPGQPVADLLTALRAQTEQREPRARARSAGASRRHPSAARRDSSPAPILPLGPCPDSVAGSAAGPGGIAPAPLGCVICTGDAVLAAHELRRLLAPLLALELPGLSSLRDRPG